MLESEVTNGKTYIKSIVHAGAPENFVYYYNTSNDSYRAEYILSSGKTKNAELESEIPTNTRNWEMYKDKSKLNLIASVHCMTKADADKLPNDNARKTGVYYWLGSAIDWRALGRVSDGGFVYESWDHCWGVRPVVSLKSGVYAVSGDGTPENPYVLGM